MQWITDGKQMTSWGAAGALATLALAATLATSAAEAPRAQAYHGECTKKDESGTPAPTVDGYGVRDRFSAEPWDAAPRTHTTRWCHNYKTGEVGYLDSQDLNWHRSGDLNTTKSWFVCQRHLYSDWSETFPRFWHTYLNPPVGGAENNIWLYTQADTSENKDGWGWFPATYVSGGDNWEPIPGLPWCWSEDYRFSIPPPTGDPEPTGSGIKAPKLDLRAKRRHAAGKAALVVRARCDQHCELRGRAVFRPKRLKAGTPAVEQPAKPNEEAKLRLRVPGKTRAKLKRRLRSGNEVKAVVEVRAISQAGGKATTKSVRVRVR